MLASPAPTLNPCSRPMFCRETVAREWKSPKVTFALRAVVLAADMLYREMGASRMRVLKLLGDETPYCYGVAADISVIELPGVRMAAKGARNILPSWIATRLNLLFPYGDGPIETALYDGEKLALRVPVAGYRPDSCALAEWAEWGATGKRILTPRRVKV